MTELGTAFTAALGTAADAVTGLVTDNVAVILGVAVVFVGLKYGKRIIKML